LAPKWYVKVALRTQYSRLENADTETGQLTLDKPWKRRSYTLFYIIIHARITWYTSYVPDYRKIFRIRCFEQRLWSGKDGLTKYSLTFINTINFTNNAISVGTFYYFLIPDLSYIHYFKN
jgi:hypothetical protein